MSHGDAPIYIRQISYAYVKEQKQSCQDTNSWWKYIFYIDVNGQGQTKDMDVRDTSSHMQYMVWLCIRTKKPGPNTKPRHRPYKFDLEVKGQRQRDTSSHGDTSISQIW